MKRKPLRPVIAAAAAVLAAVTAMVLPASPALAANCGNYYFKYFATAGSISTWCTNQNSWGVKAPNGTGFVAEVYGEDWGTWSPGTTLPKRLSSVSSSNSTWFSQTASPASGAGYDATYDIFLDPSYAPTDRNGQAEIMIWVGYRSPNKPLADKWTSSGPVPYATNVSLGGRSWDIYVYHWSSGAITMSYLDRANSGWFSGSLSPFFNYGTGKGWYTSSWYLTSVMAGWEFGHGNYTANSFGVAGF